jgi:hypothetical protein
MFVLVLQVPRKVFLSLQQRLEVMLLLSVQALIALGFLVEVSLLL